MFKSSGSIISGITDTRFLDLIILFVIFNFVDSVSVVPDFGLIDMYAFQYTGGSFSSPPQTDTDFIFV